MKLIIVIVGALVALSTVAAAARRSERMRPAFEKPTKVPRNIISGHFETPLDHFRPQDLRKVNLTFHENLDFYEAGGPFYFYFKAIGDYSTKQIEEGLMLDIAVTNGAALFTFDYRYFGDNVIFDDLTWENYEFLTIEQILGDIGVFIDFTKTRYGNLNTHTVVWGSRFGASLANYARKKFPHLINGAWSSSGIYDIYPFTYVYYDFLRDSLEAAGEHCVDRVLEGFNQLEALIGTETGAQIQSRLNLCSPLQTDSTLDIASLFEKYIDVLGDYLDQYHVHGSINFCHDIHVDEDDALSSIARWINFVSNSDRTCFEHSYSATVDRYSDTAIVDGAGRRSWYYLQCTQLGLFRITDSFTWFPAPINEQYHLQTCSDVLGREIDVDALAFAIDEFTLQVGTYNQVTSHVLYTNGLLDPWLFDGVLFTTARNSTVINIPYVLSSADFESIRGWDAERLVAIKHSIRDQVTRWSHDF